MTLKKETIQLIAIAIALMVLAYARFQATKNVEVFGPADIQQIINPVR